MKQYQMPLYFLLMTYPLELFVHFIKACIEKKED